MFGLTWEEEEQLHRRVGVGMIIVSVPTFIVLYGFIPAPWGKTLPRHGGFGPLIHPKLAWMVFESPNLGWSLYCWINRRPELAFTNQFLLSLFVLHYARRCILYPLSLAPHTKAVPLAVMASAFCFCFFNGYLQAQALCQFQHFPNDWSSSVYFWAGLVVFGMGLSVNIQSDAILRRLRRQSSSYQIPTGGLFSAVSAPHYTAELLEWAGFSLACHGSLASVAFFVYSCSNLIPRGLAHHSWYAVTFPNYPSNRKAVIPFIW